MKKHGEVRERVANVGDAQDVVKVGVRKDERVWLKLEEFRARNHCFWSHARVNEPARLGGLSVNFGVDEVAIGREWTRVEGFDDENWRDSWHE